jgi:hypothetical protein
MPICLRIIPRHWLERFDPNDDRTPQLVLPLRGWVGDRLMGLTCSCCAMLLM